MSDTPRELVQRLERHGQAHVLRFLPELAPEQRARLVERAATLDLELIDALARLARAGSKPAHVARFEPPEVFRPRSEPAARIERLRERGLDLLRSGAVGFLLVAGGQASRLGYDGPKGAFPVGPVSGRSLFEVFARRLHAARARGAPETPWYILTSEANDAATRAFFAEHAFFGLPRSEIVFFRQAMLPALDEEGRILLAGKDELFLAPNGHGGVLSALATSGALAGARERGVRVFSYFQVDNPLAPPADLLFLGLHAETRARMSSKVVRKRDASEKVGVLGRADGALSCIEYSDLPNHLREARDAAGELVFGDGNIAMHVLDLDFVAELTEHGFELPWHLARKRMTVVGPDGGLSHAHGWKFETFVFDALALAGRTATLEVERGEQFSPVKNAEGQDSPATARADQCKLHAAWARACEIALPPPAEDGSFPIEIDPCVAEDEREFAARQPLEPRVLERGHLYT